ncbi:hypothetical protein [Candidatus Harpocratesius sp.]
MITRRKWGAFFKKNFEEASTPIEMQDTVIEQHDRFNFEVKLDYPLIDTIPHNQYELEIYFFIPAALQINPITYSSKEFFSDMTNYIRFKTPQMALSGLINPNNPKSPFTIIQERLFRIKNGDVSHIHFDRINYELRVLGCIVKSTLRDQLDFFNTNREKVIIEPTESISQEIDPVISSQIVFFQDVQNLQKRLEELEIQLQFAQIPQEIQETFIFVDKYISRQISEHCAVVYSRIKNDIQSKFDKEIVKLLEMILDFESAKKSPLNPIFKQNPKKSNENITYWDGILKKYIQNVLYLDVQPSKEKSKTLEFLYSLAAGVAMFISILLGFLVVEHFSGNTYLYFTLLIVVYMLKDRFKEWIKNVSNHFVQKNFPDRKFTIFDSAHNNKIGISKESMRFLSFNQIPQEILNIRERGTKISIEHEGKPEVIFKYIKSVSLRTERIKEFHERHRNVNDIIRFNIKHFLQYADDPLNTELVWDPIRKEFYELACAKVYHLNTIFKLRAISSKKVPSQIYYKKVRVVIDQNGIRRVTERKVVG